MLIDGQVDFPPEGIVVRGRPRNSVALWLVGVLAVIVLASDVVVGLQWLMRGRPPTALYVFAAVVLALSTLLLLVTVVTAIGGVYRQGYALDGDGLWLPGRGRNRLLEWPEIREISRRYGKEPGGSTMGVAVFVNDPDRFARRSRAAANVRDHGTPIYLDLTDVTGGTVRFCAAARWYADQAGRPDLPLT